MLKRKEEIENKSGKEKKYEEEVENKDCEEDLFSIKMKNDTSVGRLGNKKLRGRELKVWGGFGRKQRSKFRSFSKNNVVKRELDYYESFSGSKKMR